MGNPTYSTPVLAQKYKEQCLDYMRKLKAKGYKIYYTESGTCDTPINLMIINIKPYESDPLDTLKMYWNRSEENYKQESFKSAFTEFEKENN
jgi:hypothetical protein